MTIFAAGSFGRANRPAVDAGRLYGDKKQAIEAGISRSESPVANGIVKFHAAIVSAAERETGRFRTLKWESSLAGVLYSANYAPRMYVVSKK
jgi:hypothetical protein